MKAKLAITSLALAILGVTVAPNAALAAPSKDAGNSNQIACFWARYMNEHYWQYGDHNRYGHDFDFGSNMIDDELDLIPEPPPMKTVEVWKGNKKEIHIVPSAKQTQVVIFGGDKLNTIETPQ